MKVILQIGVVFGVCLIGEAAVSYTHLTLPTKA